MKQTHILLSSIVLFALSFPQESINSLNIAEKRQSLVSGPAAAKGADSQGLAELNHSLQEKHKELNALYSDAQQSYVKAVSENKSPELVEALFKGYQSQISEVRQEIKGLEDDWKMLASGGQEGDQEGLWHQPDTTIGQLVIDYGSSDYIYLMPPEIATLKAHVSSQLSVPRAMWSEILELILANYGIGIKQLNPFLRQLFFLRLNQADLVAIIDSPDELKLTSPDARICYVLQPPVTELKRIFQFLEKFAPQEQMSIQVIGNSIVMVGYAREVTELMKIYDFISLPKHSHEYKLVALQKAQSEEIAKILQAIFEGDGFRFFGDAQGGNQRSGKESQLPPFMSADGDAGFKVLTMQTPSQSLFLLGKPEQIEKACQIIKDIEERVSEVQDKTVHWYACRHSEAEELADVLSQVYTKMVESPEAFNNEGTKNSRRRDRPQKSNDVKETIVNRTDNDRLIVSPPKIKEDAQRKKTYEKHENFIVDAKTNSIVMVVESHILPKLRELLKKLDVPKKMVQIDVLLFEKRVSDNNTFGLNLLKMGTAASHKHRRTTLWNQGEHHKKRKRKHHHDDDDHEESHGQRGVLQFIISKGQHGIVPAFDLAYNFLLAQEDIQINANPTVTTVNQVPAKIAIVEQISINTGVVEIDTTKATRLKDSYSREEYGITISITPTIHAKMNDESEEGEGPTFIHLATDLVFDTTKPNDHDRPDVTRRNIKNEVRVADGETVILGGLRRKTQLDDAEMVPFLGELPGVGKLFSITRMDDTSTEMFIFITPRIVPDKHDDFLKMRQETILKRPGDVPEFLQELIQAREKEKRRLFEGSIKLLLGRPDNSFLEAGK